jgi:hypothetical protein
VESEKEEEAVSLRRRIYYEEEDSLRRGEEEIFLSVPCMDSFRPTPFSRAQFLYE